VKDVMLVTAVLLAFAGVVRGAGRSPPDTSSICGVASGQALNVEWATKTATRAGTLTDLVFTSHGGGVSLGAETARAVVAINGGGTLCYVDVPCTSAAGTTITVATCPTPDFAAGSLLTMSWASSGCTVSRPNGHAAATLVMP